MPEEALVVFTPSGKRGRVPVGTLVLDAARRMGVDLDSVCGGRGICSKCQIAPSYGHFAKHGITMSADALSDVNEVEARYDRVRGLAQGRRLGCQARICGDAVIDVPPESQLHRQVIRKSASEREMTMDPAVRSFMVEVAQPRLDDPDSDFARLRQALADQWGIEGLVADLDVLAGLQVALRKGEWKATVIVAQIDGAAPRLLDVRAGFDQLPLFGLAVDLGTTTIAGHLVSLENGKVIASGGLMNPQIRYGEDLMSRVSYGMMNDTGAAELTQAVRTGLAGLVVQLAQEAGIAQRQIVDATLVGNPVMHHLLLGLDPVELGQAPFPPVVSDAVNVDAKQLGLPVNTAAQVYFLPLIAGHVGADAAAVVLSEQPGQSDQPVLIVDVGTNAEIILGDRTRVLACSSPTGPAFEGAQISSGQRAAPGAIERVRIDPQTKEPRFRIIGAECWSDDAAFAAATETTGVTGICGSGIIEVVAEMRIAGILDRSGLIGSPEQTGTARCIPDGRTFAYVLHDESASGGTRIVITQGDIRAIQLAKSAVYAGARLLMQEFGIDRVGRIVLAGAFGAHISALHALVLGMIPDCDPAQVTSAGNAAGTGARIALCSRMARREIEAEARRITRVETAIAPGFQDQFVAANAIPHARDTFAELARHVTLPDVGFQPASGRSRRRKS